MQRINNNFVFIICLIFLIQQLQTADICISGEVKSSTGQCCSPSYIEGCLTYKSATQCEVCEYNYVKKNGQCQFQQNTVTKCCQEYDFNGQCKKCAQGLFLNPSDKECIDVKIPGCIEKNADGCANCAKSHKLINGTCIQKINGCIEYIKSGAQYLCSKCDLTFDLSKGECISSSWKTYHQKQCLPPFKLNKEKSTCQIPNCRYSFELGCIECNDGYDLNKNGECIIKRIPGCLDYISQTECKVCEDNFFLLYKGVCFPYGCLEMNPNLQCISCNAKFGFVLQQGTCVIANCLNTGKNGCNICQQGRIWLRNQCVVESQLDLTACVTCPVTHFLGSNNQCQKREQGCVEYKQNICTSCDLGYVLDTIGKKCVKKSPGCNYNQKAQCISCQAQYAMNQQQQRCVIIGCGKYSQASGRCAECSQPFKLTSEGFCAIENCLQFTQKGCTRCTQNYQPTSDNKCSPYDPHCIARNIYDKCIGCHQTHYLDKSSRCQPSTIGCNYMDGLCTSCKTPFIYSKQTSTCFIDGCKEYFFGGCQQCHETYQLRYNSCKLPHCLVSSNGKCLQCDPDFIMRAKTNQCLNKDEFCYEYNKDGECVQCAPKYFMSKIQHKCLQREPGCIYDNIDKCSKCQSPFKPIQGKNKCYITGCLEHDLTTCKQCKYPFELTSDKQCAIKNCLKTDDDKCLQCISNYIMQNGQCTTGDQNCIQYKSNQCLQCRQGYRPIASKCQYQDIHCQQFSQSGTCLNCQRLYFLNPLKQCQLRDANCQEYINGYCTKCKPYFYYYNSLCYQNSKGCTTQVGIDKCQKCDDGFRQQAGKCIQSITKLNWNSIDMDFFASTDTTTKQQLLQVFTPGKLTNVNLQPCLKSAYGKLFYSSDVQNVKTVHIQADGNGWQPKSELNQYLGVEVQKKETFYAVDVKCMANNKMTSFTVEYIDSNVSSLTSAVFKKSSSYDITCSPGVIKTIYITPVQAYAIRIKTRKGFPNIKIDFYFNNQAYKPISPLSNNTIIKQTIQSTVTASNQLLTDNCKDKDMCWFGLEICEPKNVTGFTLQYDQPSTGQIDTVYVEYSVDGIAFTCYNECQGINVQNGVVKFTKTVFGAKVRVHVTSYHGQPNIKVKFQYN